MNLEPRSLENVKFMHKNRSNEIHQEREHVKKLCFDVSWSSQSCIRTSHSQISYSDRI